MEEIIKMLPRYRVPVVKKSGNKKKTHEEYVAEVAIKNPNIEVVDVYIDAKTKIKHKCLIDGYEWDAKPNNILSGKGCPKCGGTMKKTHEEYIKELSVINPYILVIGTYTTATTPILHKCVKHNIEWNVSPENARKGYGCVECVKEVMHNKLTKTHEKYVYELKVINPNIEVLEEYIDSHTPILHRCLTHNYEWLIRPSNALSYEGCPKCANNLLLTQEEYVERISKDFPHIEVIGTYINAKTAIAHKCLIHDIIWDTTPSTIQKGCGCYKCGEEKLKEALCKTQEKYIKEVEIINPHITVLGKYINNSTPILHRCKIHNIEWDAIPCNILLGNGCKECGKEKIRKKLTKTHEEYVKDLGESNSFVEVVESYLGVCTPILHKCKIHNIIWKMTPQVALRGTKCPACTESHGESQIRIWLENNDIEYIYQQPFSNCRDIKPLPFDFYLPTFNICIEYDGIQHFEPIEFFGGQESFEKTVKHDNIKNEYCDNNGISLLRIPYFKNVEEELNNFLLY